MNASQSGLEAELKVDAERNVATAFCSDGDLVVTVAEPSRNIRGKRWGSEGGGREVEVERSQWAAACDAEGWKRCRALAVWAKWNQLCKHLAQIVIGA